MEGRAGAQKREGWGAVGAVPTQTSICSQRGGAGRGAGASSSTATPASDPPSMVMVTPLRWWMISRSATSTGSGANATPPGFARLGSCAWPAAERAKWTRWTGVHRGQAGGARCPARRAPSARAAASTKACSAAATPTPAARSRALGPTPLMQAPTHHEEAGTNATSEGHRPASPLGEDRREADDLAGDVQPGGTLQPLETGAGIELEHLGAIAPLEQIHPGDR